MNYHSVLDLIEFWIFALQQGFALAQMFVIIGDNRGIEMTGEPGRRGAIANEIQGNNSIGGDRDVVRALLERRRDRRS